ncbi:AEC family transporter [Streptomyces sp. NPDC049916]|uniref:AEC family transporter n=1 Tax=unclassified Streptomyces TaxID=2593676 RepID=UPI0034473352
MQGVITGFSVIGTVIAVGYVIGRCGYLGADGRAVLTRLAFNVATPALLFTLLAAADLSVVLSVRLLVTAIATAVAAAVFVVVARVFLRWDAGRTTMGALCSSYVNAGNLGIPIAVYVLGDASLVAPVLLLQVIVMTPLALTLLDLSRAGESVPLARRLTTPLRNPMAIASLAGVVVAATGWEPPAPVLEPLVLIGNMSVPAVLLAFGISLRGAERPGRGEDRGALYLSVLLKVVLQPLVAWAVGVGLFGLKGAALLDVVVIAALPAAQNLFTYASHYRVAERFTRDSVLLSTLLSVPALVLVAVLLS